MNSVFSEQILADKLSKLKSTQQCIETLSHWCIFHRSKAEQVVKTWDKQFHVSEMVHKIPLLYLANDILQNSKRKGNEFVTEFWKVLPMAVKDVTENGDERGKTVVSRLMNIWEDRRVFGLEPQTLKDVMLGRDKPPPLEFSKKRSRSIKILKRDSRSIRTKLSIGGTAERIVSAFHLVIGGYSKEEEEMSNCKAVVHRIRKRDNNIETACANGNVLKRENLAKELEEDGNVLRRCIERLKSIEETREALVSQLKEALHEQESELENVRTQMQVAEAQAEEASSMIQHLRDENYKPRPPSVSIPSILQNGNSHETPKRSTAAIAAEVADKLAASSSSQMIMHSVLSTFAAEEARNAAMSSTASTSGSAALPQSHFLPTLPPLQPPPAVSQPQFHIQSVPPLQPMNPPLPPMACHYGFSNSVVPVSMGPPQPPPPPPSYMVSPMVPLTQQQPPMPPVPHQQDSTAQQHQIVVVPPLTGGSFRPPQPSGMMYYTQSHHS